MNSSETRAIAPISFKRALGIIIPICLVSLALAGIIISITNDIYAFVKPDHTAILKIESPLTDSELAQMLQDNDIIENAFIFKMYLRLKGKSAITSSLLGEWTLNSNMSYREIVMEFFKK